jgi:hypothetical protein
MQVLIPVFLHTPQSASGNAAKAGIKAGDTIIYHSSFFGDELWPADKLSFVNQSIRVRVCCITGCVKHVCFLSQASLIREFALRCWQDLMPCSAS